MALETAAPDALTVCRRCGLAQRTALPPPQHVVRCGRCHAKFPRPQDAARGRHAAAALAAAALILYPSAITLPVLKIEKLGSSSEDSVLSGVAHLFAEGHFAIAAIVLTFSLIVPPTKLLAILLLSSGWFPAHLRWQARAHAAVDALGRWGMLDVLVVALIIAFVKLGDDVAIAPGPGLTAFAACVVVSLLASLAFPVHALWENP